MKKIFLALMSLLICFSFSLQAAEKKGTVLVIMSNADKLKLKDGKTVETGFFLNEFAIPVREIMDAGYEVVIATPQGKKPLMDNDSKNPAFFQDDQQKMNEALKVKEKVLTHKNIRKLSDIADGNLKEYAGVFIPGGHAPMMDLMVDPNVGKILTYFHQNNKPTAMICHGPIASISVLEEPDVFRRKLVSGDKKAAEKLAKGWLYAGYDMTIFSTNEEKDAEKNKLKGNIEFYPEDALKIAGAQIKNADPKENNVVQDRELITGQNPNSDSDTARALIKAMDKNIN